jgi:hypothetical protein
MTDFFGKLKSGAEKVAFEADKMNRLNRAKGELDKLENQLQAEFEKLGKIYYNDHQTGEVTGPEYDQICLGITDLLKQVEVKDAEVRKIDAETYGTPTVLPAAPSAEQAQLQPASTPSQSTSTSLPAAKTTKFCPNCGSQLSLETKFCTNCGGKV